MLLQAPACTSRGVPGCQAAAGEAQFDQVAKVVAAGSHDYKALVYIVNWKGPRGNQNGKQHFEKIKYVF